MIEKGNELNSLYRQTGENIIVCHNKNEVPYISVPHFHSQYEIYYNISGARGFMLDGKIYECFGHDLIIVPEISAHKVIVKKNVSYERCIVNIDKAVFESIEKIYKSDNIFSGFKNSAGMIRLSEAEHEIYMALIEKYISHKKSGNEILMLGEFANIIAYITEIFDSHPKSSFMPEKQISHTDKIIYIIECSFKDICVSDIAAKMYINEDYLNRLFKEETGITLKKYLTIRKLAEAKKYLYLKKSAKEACALSGFGDYSNFLRTFKKYEGYTPKTLHSLSKPL